MLSLEDRLKKCGCQRMRFDCKENDWYKMQLFYNKRYYRFFYLTFEELERGSLQTMRKINRRGMEYNKIDYTDDVDDFD